MISIDIPANTLNVLISEEEWESRKKNFVPKPEKEVTGYLKRYRSLVTSGNKGAILEVK